MGVNIHKTALLIDYITLHARRTEATMVAIKAISAAWIAPNGSKFLSERVGSLPSNNMVRFKFKTREMMTRK